MENNLQDLFVKFSANSTATRFFLDQTVFGLFYFKKENCKRAKADKKLKHLLGIDNKKDTIDLSQYLSISSQQQIIDLSNLSGKEINDYDCMTLEWQFDHSNFKSEAHLYWLESDDIVVVGLSDLDELDQLPKGTTNNLEANEARLTAIRALLIELTSDFINVPLSDVAKAINKALANVGSFFNVDRTYIIEYRWNKMIAQNTFEWCADGIDSEIENMQALPIPAIQHWVDRHAKGEKWGISDTSKMDDKDEFKEILLQQNIKSLITFPLMKGKECLGCVGFDSVRHKTKYSEIEEDLLLIFANSLVNVFDRIRADQVLDESEDNLLKAKEEAERIALELKEAQKVAKVGSWYLDISTNKVTWSDELFSIYGFDQGAPVPDYPEFEKLSTTESWRKLTSQMDKTISTGESYELELEFYTKSRKKGWLWAKGECVFDNVGKVIGLRGVSQDITERKNIENQLHLEKTRINNIIDGVKLGTWEWNIREGKLSLNAHWAEMLGYKLEEISPATLETWSDLVHPDDLQGAQEAIAAHTADESFAYDVEFRMKHKKGHWVWIESKGKILAKDDANQPLLFSGTHNDISERKKVEDELRLFESVIKNTKDAILISEAEPFDQPSPKIQFVNDAFCDMTGYTREELISQTPRILQGEKSDRKVLDQVRETLEKWESGEFELLNYKKNGEEFWVNFSITPLADKNGWFTHWIAVERDITEQKKQEQELKLFESVIKNANDGILITEAAPYELPGPKIVFVNEALCEITGYTQEELIGQTPRILQGPNSDIEVRQRIKESLKKWEPCEYQLLNYKKNGEEFWVDISITPLANAEGIYTHWIAIERDITLQKEQEILLKETRAEAVKNATRLSDLFNSMEETVFEIDYNGVYLNVAPTQNKYLAAPPENIIGKKLHDLFPKEQADQFLSFIHHCLDNGVSDKITYPLSIDDQTIWFEGRATPTGKDKVLYIATDVTDNVEAKALLEASELQYRNLVENTNDIIYSLTIDGHFTFVSPAWYRILGHTKEEVEGHNFTEFVHPDDIQICGEYLQKVLATGEPQDGVEYRVKHKNGNWMWHASSGSPTKDTHGQITGYDGIARDITERKEAEQLLLVSEERYRTMFDSSFDAITILDYKTGQFIECNESMVKLFASETKENILNTTPWDLSPEFQSNGEQSEKLAKWNIKKAFDEGGYSFEWLHCKSDNTTFPVFITLTPLIYSGKRFILTYIKDISEFKEKENQLKKAKKKAEESEQRLLLAANSAQMGIWEWNMETNSVSWDDKVYELLGYKKGQDEPSYEQWLKSLHPEDKDETMAALTKALEVDGSYNTDHRVIHQDGTILYISAQGLVLKDDNGKPIRLIGINRDATKERTKEIELKSAKEKAEEANLAKSEFLANMSHEIRTPLNSVIGFSEVLMQTKLDNSQIEYMQSVHYSANILLDLINDVLDFSKIEAGKLDLELDETDIHQLLYQIVEMFKIKLEEREIELLLFIDPSIPQFVFIDAIRIRQVLVNLMGNAVKFTEKGEIEICVTRIEPAKEDNHISLRFEVRDTGIGIFEEKLQSIFESFTQEDSSITRKYGGTGLGLSISNKILFLMGSQLQLKSKQGEGSSFFFDINVVCENDVPLDVPEYGEINKVLVVDDNERSVMIVESLLKKSNINVDKAYNGFDALNKIQSNWKKYDAVLLDNKMPFVDGIDVVKNIKEKLHISLEDLPIIMMCFSINEEKCREFKQNYQVQGFMNKPVTRKEIISHFPLNQEVDTKIDRVEVVASEPLNKSMEIGKPILIVDDNPINRKVAKTMMEMLLRGTEIVEAESGEKALEIIKRREFDLIFMDVQMPEMSGYATTGHIRSLQGNASKIPIIALTAGTAKGEKERCIAAGMNDYMSKPITLNKLEMMVSKWSNQSVNENVKPMNNPTSVKNDFNYAALMEQTRNEEITEDLLNIVREGGLKEILDQLNDLITQSSHENEIAKIIHDFKGTSATFYFDNLVDKASQLESLHPNYDSEEAKFVMKQINEGYLTVFKIVTEKNYL